MYDNQKLSEKFRILTEGAKYDVSCASSGASRSGQKGMLGNALKGGICHSFTPDGRCISLLKILMTNNCLYDCKYCVNRCSQDIERAVINPRDLANIVIEFYRRNYIEGLFLSSAVFRSPDYTMELLLESVRIIRTEYRFNGYIHLKGIPSADPELIRQATKLVDRISLNIELPTEKSLKMLAPQKTKEGIIKPMKMLSQIFTEHSLGRPNSKILPSGQSTQMIIGATTDTDGTILRLTEGLYNIYRLKRVYYSAYVPAGDNSLLPMKPPDLLREHRLYQADWLLRFYGFDVDELLPADMNLPYDIDPKCAWALRNLDKFPVEVNDADPTFLLRVPGMGQKSVEKVIEARKYTRLTFEDLVKMRVVMKRARHFLLCNGKFHGAGHNELALRNALTLPSYVKAPPEQLQLYDFQGQPMLHEYTQIMALPSLAHTVSVMADAQNSAIYGEM